jgi:hypothetical protein
MVVHRRFHCGAVRRTLTRGVPSLSSSAAEVKGLSCEGRSRLDDMPKVDQILAEVEHLVVSVRIQEAEEKIRSLMQTMGDEELRAWDADLRLTINRFLPKRRKKLLLILDERGGTNDSKPTVGLLGVEEQPPFDLAVLEAEFEEDLEILSERHIYQWSTFYRATVITRSVTSRSIRRFAAAGERLTQRPISATTSSSTTPNSATQSKHSS